VRFQHVWRNFVVLGHGPMDAKNHGRLFRWQICPANGPFHPLNPDMGTVNDFRHTNTLTRIQ
jgi:hypothetical protein